MDKASSKISSLSNVNTAGSSEMDLRKLYTLSLSQIRKHAEHGEPYNYKPSPFNIRWIHGYNSKVGVINLNNNNSTQAFFSAGNCGVLYNWVDNTMMILQGHKHVVTCIASDEKGDWLVTADSGPENVIIIWDTSDYFPQRTMFNPHGAIKLAGVTISSDAKYLLTLGYHKKATIYWWIWSYGLEVPHATIDVDINKGGVVDMGFNPFNSDQFLLMTKRDIWICVSGKIFVIERGLLKETDDYELKIRVPEKKINPDNGSLTAFTFVQETSQILVATSRGSVLVYGYTIEFSDNVDSSNYENLRFIKVLKVEQKRINVIKSIDGVIVTGNNVGEIHFYDNQVKLLYWVHGFNVDCVKGLSFNITQRSYRVLDPKCNKICPCWENEESEIDQVTGQLCVKLLKKDIQQDATTGHKPFIIRDFIVCTNTEGVGFVDFLTEKLITILDNNVSHALSLSVHPEKPFVCIGYANGIVELFNFVAHKLFVRIDLSEHFKIVVPPKEDSIKGDHEVTKPLISVTCLKYSPSGLHLACGLDNGELIFLDPTTINIMTNKPHKDTSFAIIQINYSCDSLTLALADAGKTVLVYKFDCTSFTWTFIGKHIAHYKDIISVFFLPKKNNNGDYKLLSLGTDRIMVEYDIGSSSEEYLEILSLDRVDQTAVPLFGIPWPNPPEIDTELDRTDLPMILIANDEFKYKIVNYGTTMTLSTVLGPRYEHPVCKMQLITKTADDVQTQYLLYATKNVIGLQKMPLDGNPWKHTALLGHPVQITQLCYREDSGTLFTLGAKDNCMYQWAANYRSVDTTSKLGGSDLDPYYCLIESGRPGWLFQEIRDLFYYVQILCQGTFSPAMRRVKDFIPIDSLPDLMRALGYFPSDYEMPRSKKFGNNSRKKLGLIRHNAEKARWNYYTDIIHTPEVRSLYDLPSMSTCGNNNSKMTCVENLIIEAKYKVFLMEPTTEIDFDEFVKLYINHRPAFGDNFKKIKNAFHLFTEMEDNNISLYRDEFIQALSNNGECFSLELLWYLLTILYGHTFEDRSAMTQGDFSFLPEEITLEELAANIIGIKDLEVLSEQYSVKDSFGSQQTGDTSSESEEPINNAFF